MADAPLRVVTFNFVPVAYDLVTGWIHRHGHKHILAVTTPGPTTRPTPAYRGLVNNAPRDVDILVTTRLRKVATPLIRALEPDLIVCFSFPYRITPEICAIPRFGAVNLHPALLPALRGPNVMRGFYEGHSTFGATLHWIAPEYDTGNILSQKAAPVPEEVTVDTVFPVWGRLVSEALDEGIARALAGDPGVAQDDSQATYAAPFTEEEHRIDLTEPRQVVQRKIVALAMGGGAAQVVIEGRAHRVDGAVWVEEASSEQPGALLAADGQSLTVQTGDGALRLNLAE